MGELTFKRHPISLESVRFSKLFIETLHNGEDEVLRAPLIQASAEVLYQNDFDGAVKLHVQSEQYFADAQADDELQLDHTVAFKLELIAEAVFEIDKDLVDYADVLGSFLLAETPALIVWPYVRACVAEMVTRTGLPPLHLPMAQIVMSVGEVSPAQEDEYDK